MLEAMLYKSSPVDNYYPGSGPGPKTLALGNEDIGYFGEVTASELITHLALRDHLNPSLVADVYVFGDWGWFKFFHKGKVKFITKRATWQRVAWQTLYQAGGVYGTNDNGLYPAGTPKNQYKPLSLFREEKTWTLVPKLITGSDIDPVDAASNLVGSEYADLMFRVCTGTQPNAGLFAQNTPSSIGMNGNHATVETRASNTAHCAIRGYSSTLTAGNAFITKTDGTGYSQVMRMVLVVEGNPRVAPV